MQLHPICPNTDKMSKKSNITQQLDPPSAWLNHYVHTNQTLPWRAKRGASNTEIISPLGGCRAHENIQGVLVTFLLWNGKL